MSNSSWFLVPCVDAELHSNDWLVLDAGDGRHAGDAQGIMSLGVALWVCLVVINS